MFVSHEKSPTKMNFQKPNILRRRPKVASRTALSESSDITIVGQTPITISNVTGYKGDKLIKRKCTKSTHSVKKPLQRIKLDSYVSQDNNAKTTQEDTKTLGRNENIVRNVYVKLNNNVENPVLPDLQSNVKYADCVFDVQEVTLKEFNNGSATQPAWCFISVNEQMKNGTSYDITQPNDIGLSTVGNNLFTTSSVVSSDNLVVLRTDIASMMHETPTSPVAQLQIMPLSYACDVAECKKTFNTENKLKKHKASHTAALQAKELKQSFKCPANKSEGNEAEPCDKVYNVRADLLKHLKEDHTLDHALYSCPTCSRRFYWAGGVRAHRRACGAEAQATRRPALACPFAGCGRVFLQPCRLKEHCRAHTGHKPYPCTYPNCGWSFRTASKLVRHARRHTGERRHACPDCARAFRRREHLRDHAARHRRHHANISTADPSNGPVYLDTKKPVDKDGPIRASETEILPALHKIEPDWCVDEDPFLAQRPTASQASEIAEGEETEVLGPETAREEEACRAARTHNTWPLPALRVADTHTEVELSEGSESKIYTIRSDLFLHGNVLHSEDSEGGMATTMAVEESPPREEGTVLLQDTELGLLDAHSSIDLMQEELLYSEAAVDEYSFHLLNEGDIQTFYTNSFPAITRRSAD